MKKKILNLNIHLQKLKTYQEARVLYHLSRDVDYSNFCIRLQAKYQLICNEI